VSAARRVSGYPDNSESKLLRVSSLFWFSQTIKILVSKYINDTLTFPQLLFFNFDTLLISRFSVVFENPASMHF
jgi:hypothetical protein